MSENSANKNSNRHFHERGKEQHVTSLFMY